ncbi:hypothetical protein Salat_2556800 [Sesamum alatum]|uniref:Uncharacterized protein n=1 Tax=Sesamum alatum TaxID=300844 RepID=A0AAE1XTG0_9LAMI|nr:hypothetical protein Salat_2556800 [Sesamum alatum]
MVAKQASRVAMQPDSVLHQLLKRKYFPQSTFFDAPRHYQPSYTWGSLLRTKDLLAAGLRWRVGTGNAVPIRGVPWLPWQFSFQLILPPKALQNSTKVAALVTSSGWNEALVRSEFSAADADCILNIPLCADPGADELIWHYERSGKFSVKSAYDLACQLS